MLKIAKELQEIDAIAGCSSVNDVCCAGILSDYRKRYNQPLEASWNRTRSNLASQRISKNKLASQSNPRVIEWASQSNRD